MTRAAILLACLFLAFPAQAKVTYDNDGRTIDTAQARHDRVRVARPARQHREVTYRYRGAHDRIRIVHQGTVVGGRPAGCPRQFCGCAASIRLFGKIRPDLNLAANWLRKFPRTSPAPMMAAARRGHVMVLLSHVAADRWRVYDGNSGGGKTRIHVRSIRGFAVVNPHASRIAGL